MAKGKIQKIFSELRGHSPFTIFGALTGIAFMLLFRDIDTADARLLFQIFHPLHVVLSAMVTASLFQLHRKAGSFFLVLIIGYVGAIGITTLSDSILPFFGESILGVAVPTHAIVHQHDHEHQAASGDHEEEAFSQAEKKHEHGRAEGSAAEHTEKEGHGSVHGDEQHGFPDLHLGFIEEWWLVTPAAILGVLLAYFRPYTKLPHAGHVLLSTWASSSHVLMNTQADLSISLLAGMLVVLFLAVWLPCCVSDIIFPLLFVKEDGTAHLGKHHCILCNEEKKDKPD
ncbi:MAG: hypothetical protein ACLFV2_05300 [Desulfurivibrionaceae bacterium]